MTEPRSLTRIVAKRLSVVGPLMVLLLAVMLAAACSSTDPTATHTFEPKTGTLDVRVADQPDPDITAIVITVG
jgi:hypothetical protein